jgi:hypothetical protein
MEGEITAIKGTVGNIFTNKKICFETIGACKGI